MITCCFLFSENTMIPPIVPYTGASSVGGGGDAIEMYQATQSPDINLSGNGPLLHLLLVISK